MSNSLQPHGLHYFNLLCPPLSAAAAAKSLLSCPTLCHPIDSSPPGSPVPWDSPGKNTGVGCHCLLQCMKAKSESEVAQSCLTLSDPMDCSLPGSSLPMGFSRQEYWSGLPLPSPLLSPRVCSNSCPSSRWGHLTTSSSVIPFSLCFNLSSIRVFSLMSPILRHQVA